VIYIITKEDCPWCEKLDDYLDIYEEEDFTRQHLYIEDHPYLRNILKENGYVTVPQVWHNETHIGGYKEATEYFAENYPYPRLQS
jgi:glutaredoxin